MTDLEVECKYLGVSAPSDLPDLNRRAAHDSTLVYEWLLRFGGEEEREQVAVRYDHAKQRGVPLPKLATKLCTYQRLVHAATESAARSSGEYVGKHAATLATPGWHDSWLARLLAGTTLGWHDSWLA